MMSEESSLAGKESAPNSAGPAGKTIEEWQNIAFVKIFQVSLDVRKIFSADPRAIPALTKELQDEKGSAEIQFHVETGLPLFTSSLLERVLVSRLSLPENATSNASLMQYLVDCYVRAREVRSNLVAKSRATDLQQRVDYIDAAIVLIINYIGLDVMFPEMFPQSESAASKAPSELVQNLLSNHVEIDIFYALVNRYATDDDRSQVLYPIFNAIANEMRSQTLMSQWMAVFNLLGDLVPHEAIPGLIAELPSFCPPGLPPKALEAGSFLGPFLRVTGFGFDSADVTKTYFPNASDMSKVDQVSGIQSLRMGATHLQSATHNLILKLIKASPVLREKILDFWSKALKLNEKRNGMHFDLNAVGSFGFVHNVSFVLLRLCDPFMLPPFPKMSLIDTKYLGHPRHKYDVTGLTAMNAQENETRDFWTPASDDAPNPNFISDAFYLTMGWMHTGFVRSLTFYNTFSRDLSERQKQYAQLQKDHSEKYQGTAQQTMSEALLKRFKAQLDAEWGSKLTLDAYLLDPEVLTSTFRFYSLVSSWLLRILCVDNDIPVPHQQPLKLPLANESLIFKHLPEHILEDIAEFMLFILRFDRLIVQESYDPFVELFIVILMNPEFVKNPYLKSKLAEVIFFMTYHRDLVTPLCNHPASMSYLVPSIMRLYVDVEITGASSQFYDKFNIRYNISQILKCLWAYNVHRAKVKEISTQDVFIRFVNMMMNDTRYLLDEGLTKLAEINSLQTEMESPQWEGLSQQEKQEKTGALSMAERHALSYMSLATQTLNTFNYVSKDIPEPFLTPEIIDRLAAMLDFNLSAMVGPKCTELKVRNPEKYQFQPKRLLSDLVDIFLNLSHSPEFVRAVARDGRSYRKEWFQKAAGALMKSGSKSMDEINGLAAFVDRVEQAIREEAVEEEELGEIPEEFLDPIMFTLMEDPVTLPTSGVTLDRSTITAHLLGEKRDPFNRKELKIEDVVPNTELKEKIQQFKQSAKGKKAS